MSNYDSWLLSGPGGPEDDGPCCYYCDGPLTTPDERQSEECDACWHARQDAMNEIHAEFDRLAAEADAHQHDEPEPVAVGDQLPF